MGDPWGIGGFRGGGGGKPNMKQIVKQNLKKRQNRKKIGKNQKKTDIFFIENGLKCIWNPTKHL